MHAAVVTVFLAAYLLVVVSNVPLVLLTGPEIAAFADPRMAWVLLALVTTVAGNFTLLGSAANLIVAEQAAPQHELGFFEYLRFGVVSTLLGLPAVVAVLWCELRWFPG